MNLVNLQQELEREEALKILSSQAAVDGCGMRK
jgi:hypothetical protein